ncbi:MAG: baseplate J/gp47 family protein [Christensenellales bacterium]
METDVESVTTELISSYEQVTGHTVQPADPERLFIAWLASIIVQVGVNQNYAASQNIPSTAEGEYLDGLGSWIFGQDRKPAQAAKCTVRFHLSQSTTGITTIPAGTRVTDRQHKLYWSTTKTAIIASGSVSADVMVECETVGEVGNNFAVGQINTLVDVSNVIYYDYCENITVSDGGSDEETDDEYFEMMLKKLSSYSTAGPQDGYVYWAKSVSDDIGDVKAIRPAKTVIESIPIYPYGDTFRAFIGGDQIDTESISLEVNASSLTQQPVSVKYTYTYENGLLTITFDSAESLAADTTISITYRKYQAGCVTIYPLMKDGSLASDTIKSLIKAACTADDVKPMTDVVTVQDPAQITYDINFTYYIDNAATDSLTNIQAKINDAVDEYVEWQSAKLGRDINPSKLYSLLMQTGIKRLEITSPTYTQLSDGSDGSTPCIARLGESTPINGGYEDE